MAMVLRLLSRNDSIFRSLFRPSASAMSASVNASFSGGVTSKSQVSASESISASPENVQIADAIALHPSLRDVYNRQRRVMFLNGKEPDIAVDAWVAPNATVIGDVIIEDRSTVWYGCVIRGDLNTIKIHCFSNILERTCIHAARSSPTGLSAETVIGKFVNIGSQCSIRSAQVDDEVVIGHRCVLMEGSIVESHTILQDGSVVPPGRKIPGGGVWAGIPAKFVRKLTYDEIAEIKQLSDTVRLPSIDHADQFLPYSDAYIQAEKLKETLSKLTA